ncbi:MAG: hypothetical protein A2135_00420 [Actinobacteria bacterium RBG_16_67_15]|nr:MAG: hypothetical protein A2135_00420 [Actinobacteria bacterium RBG_16_67_15]
MPDVWVLDSDGSSRSALAREWYHEIFRRRWELLDRALKHHEAGAFEASVLIVLAQMDGIAVDVTGDRDQSFFKGFDHLEDDRTLAGHPEGLKAIARLMSRDVKATTSSGELRRHGIVHGRELGYDTRENSTRAFAALFNLIEWAQPRMQERARRWLQEGRDRWAGSDELDEDGRRRDRRGFDDAKVLVTRLVTVQTAHFEKRGCYARTIDELLGHSAWSDVIEVSSDDVDLATNTDASEFWLHVVTPTGFVFGSAGRGGDPVGWFYAGVRAPVGGISDDDWRHAARDPAHIEW